jgi:hypothetical protein
MADGDIKTSTNSAAEAPTFFSINGTYVVGPGTTQEDMLNDIGCLASCADAGLQAVIDGIGDSGSQMAANPKDAVALLFGVMHHVKMMANLANAANAIGLQEQGVGHG